MSILGLDINVYCQGTLPLKIFLRGHWNQPLAKYFHHFSVSQTCHPGHQYRLGRHLGGGWYLGGCWYLGGSWHLGGGWYETPLDCYMEEQLDELL